MGKRSNGSSYTSKGERPNVSRRQLLDGRRERKANPTVKSIMDRDNHRKNILSRTKDKNVAEMRQRYIEEDSVTRRADALFKKHGSKGATWAACIQAIKTDWASSFELKWSER